MDIGVNVPDDLVYALAPAIFVMSIGFITWVIKKITVTGTNMETRMAGVEDDIKEIKYMMQRQNPPKET